MGDLSANKIFLFIKGTSCNVMLKFVRYEKYILLFIGFRWVTSQFEKNNFILFIIIT